MVPGTRRPGIEHKEQLGSCIPPFELIGLGIDVLEVVVGKTDLRRIEEFQRSGKLQLESIEDIEYSARYIGLQLQPLILFFLLGLLLGLGEITSSLTPRPAFGRGLFARIRLYKS